MKGDIDIVNKMVANSDKCPVKDDIGKHDVLHIISVINDEFFKEFKRKLDYSHCSSIKMEHLGNFTVMYSPLKGHIHQLIILLRKLRALMKKNVETKPNYKMEESEMFIYSKEVELKLKAAWAQLEEQRKIYILKYLLFTNKKRLKNPDFKPNKNYTWFDYSFKHLLLNNSKVVLKNIQSQD